MPEAASLFKLNQSKVIHTQTAVKTNFLSILLLIVMSTVLPVSLHSQVSQGPLTLQDITQ